VELNAAKNKIKLMSVVNELYFQGIRPKPIRWIGTQRTAFTHRKKQKRIKEVVASTIANL